MNIITGTTGQPHITPTQDAMWHRGLQSVPSGIFDVGMKFAPVKVNNNTVRVQSGCLSIQGRFACINPATYDEVAIENGAQGMMRIDIICARLSIDETHNPPTTFTDLYVFKGKSSSRNPVAPAIPETDLDNADIVAYLPLVKVEISGITINKVTMIANVLNLAGKPVYDTQISNTSENAVQNKVIAAAITEVIGLFNEKTIALEYINSIDMSLRESMFVDRSTAPQSDGQICWVCQ